ncbi:MAG TPA: aldehyde ferredoxin oxidoreductase family protein [Clostridia bacterium]|nr:aldehyde ferredoxin oxidoreductase family protein [Clostridia bacterium]
MYGFMGKILHVDLTSQKFYIEKPDAGFYRKYVGGSCLGGYYVFKNMETNTNPLDENNVIVFSVSPTTGAAVSGASRHCVTSKSPLTNTIASSEAGGYWGPELKFSGFDAIVITGKAPRPVYLWVHDDEFELKDASHIWGKITGEAQDIIREELGDDRVRVALIGPGGENLVKYACISNELGHFNGRNGMGAVMGSKNLKAIAVRGSKKLNFYDPEGVKEVAQKAVQKVRENPGSAAFKELGTNQNFEWHTPVGGVPTRNWSSGTFENVEKINARALKDSVLKKSGTCWACAQSCKRVVEVNSPPYVEAKYGGPEYESAAMCGSNLGIDDIVGISKINEMCSKYTLDTISFGGVVGFVMECFEKGIISVNDTCGIPIRFGDAETVIKLVEMTAKRIGVGNLLAEGTAVLAEMLGPEAQKYAVHVKGKEFPAHMPQVKASMALAYACLPGGPDHVSSEHDPIIATEDISYRLRALGFDQPADPVDLNNEKSKLFWTTQCSYSIVDSFSICQFIFGLVTILDYDDLVYFVNYVTGWQTNLYELMLIGERKVQIFHAFNQREGFTPLHDILPEKLYMPLENVGPSAGFKVSREDFLNARNLYYGFAGWDPITGEVSENKLRKLGLEWIIECLSK